MKLITIIGARPQFIKAAAVSKVFSSSTSIHEKILHTGQHHDANMSDVFFSELEIPKPQFHLDIHGGNHGEMTGRMLIEIEKVYLHEKPDLVLVYGDTNSTLAGSLAASKLHIPVAHVEAGLRSFNMKMPEEINRILTDHVSTYLFTPTEVAVKNLVNEGFAKAGIHNVGDVMYDAALYFGQKAEKKSTILKDLEIDPKSFILTTIHRAENTDSKTRLEAIFKALQDVSLEKTVVLPLHPRTRKLIEKDLQFNFKNNPNLKIIEPVGYLDMVQLEKNAELIATDSGGVQKEAFFYEVPCVTLRDQTEWTELVALGWNDLVSPTDSKLIQKAIFNGLGKKGKTGQPYGNGKSGQKILEVLSKL